MQHTSGALIDVAHRMALLLDVANMSGWPGANNVPKALAIQVLQMKVVFSILNHVHSLQDQHIYYISMPNPKREHARGARVAGGMVQQLTPDAALSQMISWP